MSARAMLACLVLMTGFSLAQGDTQGTNPATGHQEQVYTEASPSGIEAYWRESVGGNWSSPSRLTSNSLDDLAPQICFDGGTGRTFVVYYRDQSVPVVLLRWRDPSSNTWSSEVAISSPVTDSRSPACAYHSGAVRTAMEARTGTERKVVVGAVSLDCPGPGCPPIQTIIRTTNMTSTLQVQIHIEANHLWVDWVDSTTQMGFSVFDGASQSWGAFEIRYIGTDVPTARSAIRAEVLGL